MPSWKPRTTFSQTRFENYTPGQREQARTRLQRFERMNRWVTARGGWVISLPGEPEITVEALEDSSLPADLREAGHRVVEIDGGQRILPTAITEVVLIEGSTSTRMVRHAGIVPTRRWQFVI